MYTTINSIEIMRTAMERYPLAEGRSPSGAIIDAIADHADTSPLELQPLQHSIDLEALDVLLTENGDVSVAFEYEDWNLVVESDHLDIHR